MYISSSSLAKNQTPIRRKMDIPDAWGRPRIGIDPKTRQFCNLGNDDLLDTADIGLLYGVAPRTVYRWVGEKDLKPFIKVGRELLFRKGDLLYWDEHFRPAMGRPRNE